MVSDPDFAPETLIVRLRLGATQPDLVRLHGVIVATLNLYPRPEAIATVFAPALDRLTGEAHVVARAAIAAHLQHAQAPTSGSVVG